MTRPVNAVILAGGKASAEFEAACGVACRALAPLAPGKTMLSFVVSALSGAANVGKVVVVGDFGPDEMQIADPPRLVAGGRSLLDSVLSGLAAVDAASDDSVLLVGSDIPFVTSAAIDDFVVAARSSGADFCYPIVPMPVYRREFSGLKRTTLKLREGEFTGGNIMIVRAGVLTDHPDRVRAAYDARKSVRRFGAMLGWGVLLRIAVSQLVAPRLLSIGALEAALARLLGPGARATAIVTEHASIGTDIDRPEDVEMARRILSGRGPGG